MTTTFMPFLTGDYLKNTMHLSTEEHGAYFLMLIHLWHHDKIRNDKKTLKNITKLSSKKLQNILPFFVEKDGFLTHQKVDEEKVRAEENQKKTKERAEKAAAARWKKDDACSIPQAMLKQCPSPSPSPTPNGVIYDDDAHVEFVKISKLIQERMKGRILNTQRVRAWLKAGADEMLILQVIDQVMLRKDGKPPNTLMYFDAAINQAIQSKTQPMPEGNDHDRHPNNSPDFAGNVAIQKGKPAQRKPKTVDEEAAEFIAKIKRGEV